jgi:hypothetical protein
MNPHKELFEFVLAQAETAPTRKKIRLYRALAELAGEPKLTAELSQLANALEAADKQCREFNFRFFQDQ